MSEVTVTEQISVITLDISAWSGGVTLKQGELGVNLPSEAFTRGRKMLVNKASLNPAYTLRRRAQEHLLKVGTRFLGGYAVPKEYLAEALDVVKGIQSDYAVFVDQFVSNLSQEVDDWVAQDWCTDEMEIAIRRSIPGENELRSRFTFEYGVFDIKPADGNEENLERQTGKMGESILSEVAQAAGRVYEQFVDDSRNKEARISRRLINGSISGLRKKLYGLEFVDKRIPPVRKEFDAVLGKMGDSGDVTGGPLGEMLSMLIILSDVERMKQLGEGLLNREDLIPANQRNSIKEQAEAEKAEESSGSQETPKPAPVGDLEDQGSKPSSQRVYVGF